MRDETLVDGTSIDLSEPLKVYWAPGCSACLRMKEFLSKNGVSFVSVNALEDVAAMEDLAKIGVRRVPIAARGSHWADGQVLADLARVAGIALGAPTRLSPEQLIDRGARVLDVAMLLLARLPEAEVDVLLPGRPRSYKQLGCHIFQILELFLDLVERGRRVEYDDYFQPVPATVTDVQSLLSYCGAIRDRFDSWAARRVFPSWTGTANVYYGRQTLHEFLERSVWHAAQHTRQVEAILRKSQAALAEGLTADDMAGLPMPDEVYDDTIKL